MKHAEKYLSLGLFAAAVFCAAVPAPAQENYYNPSLQKETHPVPDKNTGAPPAADVKNPLAEQEPAASNSFTVTSIQKCYAQLKHEEALEIQQNYLKPYEECRRRLALKLKNEREKKPGSTGAEAEKPKKFFSVFRRDDKPGKDADKKEDRPAPFIQEQVPLK